MAPQEPIASVVMAAFNGARSLADAVRSVQAQTFQDWELLVVDDLSSDQSVRIVLDLAHGDDRIRLIQLEQNSGGPARPRNRGIAEARGRFCFLIDQDDLWAPDKMEKQLAKLESGRFGMVYSDAYVIGDAAAPQLYSERWGPMADGDVRREILARCFVPALTAAVPRDVARRVGEFDEALAGVDDYDYWIRIALAGYEVGYVDEPLGTWVDSAASLSRHRVQQIERARACLAAHRRDQPTFRDVIDGHRESLRRELLAARLAQRGTLPRRRWLLPAVGLVRDWSEAKQVARAWR